MIIRIAVVLAIAAQGAACTSGVQRALGMEKNQPDEFAVVRRAPLVRPPEYNLRPPRPGEARPQELQPQQQAQAAIFGESLDPEDASGEALFLERAGALYVEDSVRALVDAEESAIVRKSPEVVEHILYADPGDNALNDVATGGKRPEIDPARGLPGVF
jgi:hypothetical protein